MFAQLKARGPTLNPNTSVQGDQMEPLIFICSLLLEKNNSIPFDISHVAEIGSLSGAEQMEKRLSVGQIMYTATIGSSYAGRSNPIGSCNCNEDVLQHICPRYMAVV